MTQEEKQLLLQDLSARLPYVAKIKCPFDDEPYTLLSINWNKEIVVIGFMMDGMYVTSKQKLVDIKPYLRPLSSMTEEEKNEHFGRTMTIDIVQTSKEVIDWLNKKMFDYRGLIPKDLAISTEVFNPYK